MSEAPDMNRPNPLLGQDDALPEGVLSPFDGNEDSGEVLKLLGLPDGKGLGQKKDISTPDGAGPRVLETLTRVSEALDIAADTGRAWRYRLDHLGTEEHFTFLDALGRGEVSIVVAGDDREGEAQIYETVLPGVWVGQANDREGEVAAHWVEVGSAPRVLREMAYRRPREDFPIEMLSAPSGAMNVMSVLAEVRTRMHEWREGMPNHVMNFTLFPMTPADSAYLAKVVGEVGVRISSGGYGAARVIMTGLRHVWAVQYLNGLGAVILDTLEIGDIPDAVLASEEDFQDSAGRLRDMLEAYTP